MTNLHTQVLSEQGAMCTLVFWGVPAGQAVDRIWQFRKMAVVLMSSLQLTQLRGS